MFCDTKNNTTIYVIYRGVLLLFFCLCRLIPRPASSSGSSYALCDSFFFDLTQFKNFFPRSHASSEYYINFFLLFFFAFPQPRAYNFSITIAHIFQPRAYFFSPTVNHTTSLLSFHHSRLKLLR